MAVHAICPSVRCRKILTLADDVRGTVVKCRYCNMEFRIPLPQRPVGSSFPTAPIPLRGHVHGR
jgi:hypothetical protein